MNNFLIKIVLFLNRVSRKLVKEVDIAFHLNKRDSMRIIKSGMKQKSSPVVIDAGAYKGKFSEWVLSCSPDSKLYIIEPVDELYNELKKKPWANNAFFSKCALGETDGYVVMGVNEYLPGSSILKPVRGSENSCPIIDNDIEPRRVEQRKLDSLIPEELDDIYLLKLDLQGYEMQALLGAEETIKKVKYILIELSFREVYEGGALFDEVVSHLINRGFRVVGDSEWLFGNDGMPLQADFLFCKPHNETL